MLLPLPSWFTVLLTLPWTIPIAPLLICQPSAYPPPAARVNCLQSEADHFPLTAANLLLASSKVQRFEHGLQASEWPPQYFLTLSPSMLPLFSPGHTTCAIFQGLCPRRVFFCLEHSLTSFSSQLKHHLFLKASPSLLCLVT